MITMAVKNKRSEDTIGCPRPRFDGRVGIGRRSTSLTHVTRSESWDAVGSLLFLSCDYHNARGTAELSQASSWVSYV